MAPERAQNLLYNDIVIVEGGEDGKPILSFTAYEDVDGVIDLCKSAIRDKKMRAVTNGDPIPDLRIGRVCVDLDTPPPNRAWVDFNFQKSQLGNSPTPNPKARGGLVPA